MANNKVLLGNEVLIDLTDSTVNPNVLLAGYKAYDASGNAITGEFSPSYHITLTQAQYDQLSQTEKMADENFFYITDAVVVGADIDDTTTSTTSVWSSSKTNIELGNKANTTDVNNKHKVTSKQVSTTGWTADTTSQSGTTLYKKTIALSHVYVESPIVDIGASGVLPTVAEQEAYDLLQYVVVNGTTLTLYGSEIPTTAYYINITGVD